MRKRTDYQTTVAEAKEKSELTLKFRHVDKIAAAAVAFIFKVTLQIGVYQFRHFRSLLCVMVTFIAVGILHIPLIIALLSLAPLAIWLCNRPYE